MGFLNIKLLVLVVGCGSAPPENVPDGAPPLSQESPLEEKLLATIPDGIKPDDIVRDLEYFVFAPHGQNVAYMATDGRKSFVMWGNKKGEEFDAVLGRPVVSPLGTNVAYCAKKDGKSFVVIGSKKGTPYDGASSPVFGNEDAAAFVANVGGKPGRFGFLEGGQFFVVVGNQEGEKWDSIIACVLARDGHTATYGARRGKESFLVSGDQKQGPFEDVGLSFMSPDGKKAACPVRQSGKWYMLSGDWKSAPYDDFVNGQGFGFSEDGKEPVFTATAGGTLVRVRGDRRLFELRQQLDVSFAYSNPDGSRTAYTLSEIDKDLNESERLVVDRKKGPAFESVGVPAFSPDGRTVCYVARRAKKYFLVAGEKVFEFDYIHWVPPLWTSDSRKVAFGARIGRELWWKVVTVN